MFGRLNASAIYPRICNGLQMLSFLGSKFQRNPFPTMQRINSSVMSDDLMFDTNPRLNIASFVTTWTNLECDKLILQSLNKKLLTVRTLELVYSLYNHTSRRLFIYSDKF